MVHPFLLYINQSFNPFVLRQECRRSPESLAGQIDELSTEEIQAFYKTTGIDITGYRELASQCCRCWTKYILMYIDYVKSLQEFMELSLNDRIILLKGTIGYIICARHTCRCKARSCQLIPARYDNL